MIGVAIWGISLVGESLADAQLARFRANPANRGLTCRAGLWRYSRHPNYFFEWLHWLTYVALAAGSPIFWLAVRRTRADVRVSAMGERHPIYRGAGSADSRRRTTACINGKRPMFFPWFPKEVASVSTERADV